MSNKSKKNRNQALNNQVEEVNRDRLELDGTIVDHAHDIFRVEIDGSNGNHIVKAKLSGKMRMYKINLEVGDRVRCEVSPYDTTNGRITIRHRIERRGVPTGLPADSDNRGGA